MTTELVKGITDAFAKVKEEFNEHLDSINQNSSEIDVLHAKHSLLAEKIDKIDERLEHIELLLNLKKKDYSYLKQIHLSFREKDLFNKLYTQPSLLCSALAVELSCDAPFVDQMITALMSKGIPIIRKQEKNDYTVALDPDFKEYHAVEGVVKVTADNCVTLDNF